MTREAAIVLLSQLSADTHGTFRGATAVARGVHRNQLTALCAAGVIVRELADTYRMAAVPASSEQRLRAALLWAGDHAAAAVLSAAEVYRLEGVRAAVPEIVVPRKQGRRAQSVRVHRADDLGALMIRTHRGLRVTGVEATLLALAHALDAEAFEIAFEDARRRRLTSVAGVRAYVPLEWKGRTYLFDFNFGRRRTILETNGRRWHDDPADYERDNEKWSVPGRHGYKLVLATWDKVTRRPLELIEELRAAHAA